jgi:hypothetical protein
MNTTHLVNLCDVFKLGIPIGEPERIHGGLLHVMWHISTEKSTFAIKQLSPNIDLKVALWQRKPKQSLVVHSDRGSQYTSHDYRELLKIYGYIGSYPAALY